MDSATPERSLVERLRDDRRQQASARQRRRMHRSLQKARSRRLQQVGGCPQEKGAGLPGLATAQGLYLLLTGMWPLVHYRSFEWVSGPKVDDWLVKCVGGLAAKG